jgi:hypothetical protein
MISEEPRNRFLDPSKVQLGDSTTLKSEKSFQSANLLSNGPKRSAVLSEVRNPTYQRKGMESKIVSEASKSPLTQLSESQQ